MSITHLTPPNRGFTRADLCVVLMAVALLAFIALPALAKMKPHSDRVSCANNLRQINLALAMYAADNHGQLPLRIGPSAWPTKLFPGYKDLRLLVCPSDGPNPPVSFGIPNYPADQASRSYIINGWNDYYAACFGSTDRGLLSRIMATNAIHLDAIPFPTTTVAFGEKENRSAHVYMDFLQGLWNETDEIEQARHDRSQQTPQTGGSNHAMVDGQVQYLKYGAALAPVNLWAVTEQYRTNAVPVP
jgi:hypothetical protein